MTCPEIERELVAFHFGVVDAETRAAVDGHLVGCRGCLGAFLALKRDLETGEGAPRPSAAVRQRVRNSVAAELGLAPRRRWWWWERPLAFGLAGATVLAAALLVGGFESKSAAPHGMAEAEVYRESK